MNRPITNEDIAEHRRDYEAQNKQSEMARSADHPKARIMGRELRERCKPCQNQEIRTDLLEERIIAHMVLNVAGTEQQMTFDEAREKLNEWKAKMLGDSRQDPRPRP